jgi:hypothetical protein
MNLHDVFAFLLNFQESEPHSFLMWLEKYPKLEQDSLVCLTTKSRSYKLKEKIRNKNIDHKIAHQQECTCKHYYDILVKMNSFPFSMIGKCLGNRKYNNPFIPTIEFSKYAEVVVKALSFQDVPHTKTLKLQTKRFRCFPKYEIKPGTLTVYKLLTLLKAENFNFFVLTQHLDVIEIALIYVLVDGAFSHRFIDNLLPNYCRTLRFVDTSIGIDTHRDILLDIYEKFSNVGLRKQFPDVNYISMALRPLQTSSQIPVHLETIQLGYIGERFVMHATSKKMYTMNDFGEYVGVYSQYIEYPFDDAADFIFECVKTRMCCYVVDIYAYNKTLVYNEPPRKRTDLLMNIIIKDTSEIRMAPLINPGDIARYLDLSQDILKYGTENLVYDSLIFRCNKNNAIIKYRINKPHIIFETCGSIRTDSSIHSGYNARYSGYFLLKLENKYWTINVWCGNLFICVGKLSLPWSFFETKKIKLMVKVSFNALTENKVDEIVAVVPKKFKSIYNCLSLEDLVKIK